MRTKKLAQKHGLDAKVVDIADADLAVLSKAKNIIVYRRDLGRRRPAGPRRRFLRGADDMLRRASKACALPSSRWAIRLTRSSAPQARRSTSAWQRSAARAPSTVSTSISTMPSRRPSGPRRRWASSRPPSGAATRPSCTSISRVAHGHADDDDEPQFTAENPLTGEISALGQPQRLRLDARDVARRDRQRGAGLLLSAGRCHRHRAGERSANCAGAVPTRSVSAPTARSCRSCASAMT